MDYDSPRFNLNVRKSRKSSRFKVDLLAVQEEQEELRKELEKRNLPVHKRLWCKVNDCDYGAYLAPIKKNASVLVEKSKFNMDEAGNISFPHVDLPPLNPRTKEKLERLSFYWIFRVFLAGGRNVFKYLSIVSYYLGKWTMFGLRFFYYGAAAITNGLKKKNTATVKADDGQPEAKADQLNRQSGHVLDLNDWEKPFAEPAAEEPAQTSALVSIVKTEMDESEFHPHPHLFTMKRAFSFAIVLFLLVLPLKSYSIYARFNIDDLKGRVLGAADSAIGDIKTAAGSAADKDFTQAAAYFTQAGSSFLEAQEQVEDINGILLKLAGFLPKDEFKLAANAKAIIAAGESASNLAASLSKTLMALQNHNDYKGVTSIMDEVGKELAISLRYANDLNSEFAKIRPASLPSDLAGDFAFIRDKSLLLEDSLAEFKDILEFSRVLLGADMDKRYLLVFQNNSELRASGGFVGSYALVDFSRGKIKNLEAPGGGSYDTEAGLYEKIIAPEPLWLVNPLWHFWDANWWPDWEDSAKKLKWFYEKSGGPTVDGVISLTPTVVERLLDIIGPIDMQADYGVTITADNFWETVQAFSEQKQDITNKPKAIIGDLLEKILEELPQRLNKDTLVGIIKTLEEVLSEKHFLVYLSDEDLQAKVEEFGWDGKLKDTNWDYLSVVHTNIAGGKSDRKIINSIKHSAAVMEDGSIIDTLTITRQHTGIKREEFIGVRNNDWLRVYVPQGSELLAAVGFSRPDEEYFEKPDEEWRIDPDVAATEGLADVHEPSETLVYTEDGKTVFANWSQIDPGESTTIVIKYKLPFKLEAAEVEGWIEKLKLKLNPDQEKLVPYALLVQKQPGTIADAIRSQLILGGNAEVAWRYPEGINTTNDGWDIKDTLETDRYWAVLLSQ